MSNVTNLNRFRKQQARETRRSKADANAALHGLSKSEKQLQAARDAQARSRLDGHLRDTASGPRADQGPEDGAGAGAETARDIERNTDQAGDPAP